MRFTRLIIGFLIILIAIFVIAGEQLAGVSSNAFINARTTTVRAPIAGNLSVRPRLLGSRVQKGEELGSIEAGMQDDGALLDLTRERASAQAEIARLEAVVAAVSAAAQAETDIALRRAELEAALEAEKAKLKAVEDRLAAERVRRARRSSATLVSNVNGLLWEVLAADGETIERGQELLRLVDCDSAGVTLSVAESIYNRLRQGDSAVFRASRDGRTFEGTITRLAGSGAETVYRNLAIPPSERHLERFDVTLYVPALRQDEELKCAVGRTGRVFFEGRPLDFFRRFWD